MLTTRVGRLEKMYNRESTNCAKGAEKVALQETPSQENHLCEKLMEQLACFVESLVRTRYDFIDIKISLIIKYRVIISLTTFITSKHYSLYYFPTLNR